MLLLNMSVKDLIKFNFAHPFCDDSNPSLHFPRSCGRKPRNRLKILGIPRILSQLPWFSEEYSPRFSNFRGPWKNFLGKCTVNSAEVVKCSEKILGNLTNFGKNSENNNLDKIRELKLWT